MIKDNKRSIEEVLKKDAMVRRESTRAARRNKASFIDRENSNDFKLVNLRSEVEEYMEDLPVVDTDKISLLKTKFALDYGSGDPFYNLKKQNDEGFENQNHYDRQIHETLDTLIRYPKI